MKKTKFSAQFDKRPVKDGVFPCDEILEGDGEDPRYDSKSRKVANRKALQLCAQVADILNAALPGMKESILRELYVASVVPAPDSTQLLVTVSSIREQDELDVLHYLEGAEKSLRMEVAAGITRKRVPSLKFRYVERL